MIKKLIRRILGKAEEAARPHPACRSRPAGTWHRPGAGVEQRDPRDADPAGSRLQGLRGRRRGARPAAGRQAEGLRHRHQRHAGGGQAAVPARLHHRPALPDRARDVRPGPAGSDHLPRRGGRSGAQGRTRPRAARQHLRRAARRRACGATSPSTRCTTTRPRRWCSTTTAASPTSAPSTLRIIGVPEARYREDPVRMLRVVRFAAKLGFDDRPVARARRSP